MRVGLMDYKVNPGFEQIWQLLAMESCESLQFVPPEIWKIHDSYYDSLNNSDYIDVFYDLWAISAFRELNFQVRFLIHMLILSYVSTIQQLRTATQK